MTLRRDFIAVTAGAVVARTVLPAVAGTPECAFTAITHEAAPLAAAFERNALAFFDLPEGHADLHRVAEMNNAPAARLDTLADRVLDMEARSMPGYIAKAHLLRHQLMVQFGIGGEFVPDGMGAELAMSLANDLLARPSGTAGPGQRTSLTSTSLLPRPDTPSDRFIASVVANDPKLRTMLAILRAMSPGEADAWLEFGRRMVRTTSD